MTSNLLINEPPLQVLPTLARTIGLNEAIILQQVHYWLNPQLNKNFREGKHWVHNTFTQWERQFAFWSRKTIQRTITSLEDTGLLISFVTRGFKKTKYYTVDYGLLNRLCPPDLNTRHLTDPQGQDDKTSNVPELAEKQGFCTYGQHDHIERDNLTLSKGTKCPHREGQFDLIDEDKMTTFHYTENTPEITSENTLPPLTPPSQRAERMEEEEEGFYSEQENPNRKAEERPLSRVDSGLSEAEDWGNQQTREADFCSELLSLWNRIVQDKLVPGSKASLTPKRKILLNRFLEEVLHHTTRTEKIDAWQNYCTLITKTRFLMGQNSNGFKVTLDWATVPDNAFRVLEGAYYDKPEVSSKQPDNLPWEEFAEELVRTHPGSKYLTQWVKMSVIIARFIGQGKYKSWFTKVALSEVTETTATFSVEGRFTKDSIIRYFSSEVRCAVQSIYPNVNDIEFKLVSSLGSNE